MQLERLKTMVKLIRQLPPESFNLSTLRECDMGLAYNTDGKPEPSCGSMGCVIGWATMVPEFNEAGLTWDKNKGLRWRGSYANYEAAGRDLFEIDLMDSMRLFDAAEESIWDRGFSRKDLKPGESLSHVLFERRLAAFCAENNLDIGVFA